MKRREARTIINLYLLKQDVSTFSDAVKGAPEQTDLININQGSGKLYYKNVPEAEPKWVKKLKIYCQNEEFKLTSSSCSALILIKPAKVSRFFALTYGYGRNLLKPELIEDGFGLRIALNVVNHEKIKSIDVKNLDTVIKNVRMDNSKETDFGSFGANIERDILNGVVGVRQSPEVFEYSEKIYGKDALRISAVVSISELPIFCQEMFKIYNSEEYKKHFRWIDHIKIIRDKVLLEKLNHQMINAIHKEEYEKVWMTPPEIIDWYDKEGFSYTPNGKIYEDIGFGSLLEGKNKTLVDIDLEFLSSSSVHYHCSSQQAPQLHWSVYKCIYSEIDIGQERFILVGGNWYSIDKEYLRNTNTQLKEIKDYVGKINFIKYAQLNEEQYNKDLCLANAERATLFDRQNIPYGGGHSSIEFCDVYFDDKQFIHVKRYSGSSTLSHLFFQGLTPAYLLKAEQLFLKKVNIKLREKKVKEIKSDFDPSSYEVVYAIAVASEKKDIRDILPFFSKVTLVHAAKELSAYGYKVSIKSILVDRTAIKEGEKVINEMKAKKRKHTLLASKDYAEAKT